MESLEKIVGVKVIMDVGEGDVIPTRQALIEHAERLLKGQKVVVVEVRPCCRNLLLWIN